MSNRHRLAWKAHRTRPVLNLK